VSDQRQLPMAPAGCSLEKNELEEQLDRYRRLGSKALSMEDRDARLVIAFSADVDVVSPCERSGAIEEVMSVGLLFKLD
jgi:hypothetical protein